MVAGCNGWAMVERLLREERVVMRKAMMKVPEMWSYKGGVMMEGL
jgi:hypothetical protein